MKTKGYYNEGGFLDDGASVDPISGNEVPTGSLQEEVRDDIPAQLSEGEFVFPADVVRFIGLGQLMKIRDKAKTGLVDMEAEGQIGGSPTVSEDMPSEMAGMSEDADVEALIEGLDRDDFEAGAMNFARGGMPTYDSYTALPEILSAAIRDVKYVNKEGEFITIPTVNGDPLKPIPEGYFIYVPPDEDDVIDNPVEDVVEEAAKDDPSVDEALTAAYRNDKGQDGYDADLRRSERIRSDRATKIEELASSNMNKGQMDVMYAALTPQAKMIYDTRFRDESSRGFLDGFMASGKSPTDLLITAQKTADSQNRAAGTVEPDSGYTPSGKPIDWKAALKYTGLGLVLGPTGLVGNALSSLTSGEKEEATGVLSIVGKILGTVSDELKNVGKDSPFEDNSTQPTEVVNEPYTKLNQDYWKNFKGDVSAEKRRLEGLTGLNAYGHKIYKEPGSRTIWDQIAEVESNKQNSIDARNKREQDAIDELALTNQENARNNSSTSTKPYSQADTLAAKKAAEDRATDKHWGLAAGGLASKKKPTVKKMRSDNTAGLASKKKAKQKAKAKKGALAAKRT